MRRPFELTQRQIIGLAAAMVVLVSLGAHSRDNDGAEAPAAGWALAFFDSFNQHMNPDNLDRWMENWADDAERITPMGNARGKVEIRRLYEDLQSRYRDMSMKIVGLIAQDDRASVELETRGIHKATGIEVFMPNVAVLRFDPQGKVASAHVYLDMRNVERQIQEQSPAEN
jgi:hypothetical protein